MTRSLTGFFPNDRGPDHRPVACRGMTAPVPRITNHALQESVDAVLMQVDRDTILRARAVLLHEADQLDDELYRATSPMPTGPLQGRMGEPGHGVWIGRCSDDPISGPAQISFNAKIDAALQPCRDYIRDLRIAGEQLGTAALRYGYTEEEVRASFRSQR